MKTLVLMLGELAILTMVKYKTPMTERFTFGEHSVSLDSLRHTMSVLKDIGAKVTVETTTMTRHNFVLHTVCAEMPKKAHPIVFTRPGEL